MSSMEEIVAQRLREEDIKFLRKQLAEIEAEISRKEASKKRLLKQISTLEN